ncbi:MAG: DUF481 domain-containing protein [Bacteriovoracaceae bacterium]
MKKFLNVVLVLLVSCPLFANDETIREFSHLGEASVVLNGGNSEISTYNFKTSNSYRVSRYTGTIGGHYTYGTAFDVVSVRNYDVNAKIDTKLVDELGFFLGETYEGDKFGGIKYRFNTDLGLSYPFLNRDHMKFTSEIGYRNKVEKNEDSSIDMLHEHMARIEGKFVYISKDKFIFNFDLEYLPNFTDSNNFQINGSPSFTFTLSSIFSLKIGYRGRYDNKPSTVGNKKYDYLYTTALISKF